MARLRQQYPNNYLTSGNISTEFENLVRYLNVAELGNKTIGELIGILFDSDGDFAGPIELRLDSTEGLQYRVGTYASAETGWLTLTDLASIRGTAGANVGDIGAPIMYARQDSIATASQTVFNYAHSTSDEMLVYKNGLLQREGGSYDYTTSTSAGSTSTGAVTFNTGLTAGNTVSIFKIRADDITGYTRTNTTIPTGGQAVFAFTHDEDTSLQVYRNGILQREGGSYDYTTSHTSNTVTFTTTVPAADVVSILTIENVGNTVITGLMLEGVYTDTDSGLIDFTKLSIANDEIPVGKVNGLTASLAGAAKLTVSATAPVSPASGDLWHDTSVTPDELKFYDGTQWLSTAPEQQIPTFTSTNAGQFLQVNGSGTATQFADVDVSALVPKTYMGASNGVASLDSLGRLPNTQLPTTLTSDSYYFKITGAVANGNFVIKRLWKAKINLTGISVQCGGGTCTVTTQKGGADMGSDYPTTVTTSDQTFSSVVEVDATTTSTSVGFKVSSVSSCTDLEVTLAVADVTT